MGVRLVRVALLMSSLIGIATCGRSDDRGGRLRNGIGWVERDDVCLAEA